MFDNSYSRLPEKFFSRVFPVPVPLPNLVKFNWPLADQLGFDRDQYNNEELARIFSGNEIPLGGEPIAMAYAGHQFGNFVPRLGDGRAILLGEVVDKNGIRYDVHLKGSGRTPFSRHADGRSPLGPALREYIMSEAMYALGVPTTRSLAVVATGENVQREALLPGAVLTRVAKSHIRVGTFQYFAARKDIDSLRVLADYTIDRLYPDLKNQENRFSAFLWRVVEKQAELIAHWMSIGFIHGVMNTDNMTVSGETIDYGPCAFMDDYHPETVYSSIDVYGRYAYGNQPSIAIWNLTRLAESLLPLLNVDEDKAIETAQSAVQGFVDHYESSSFGIFSRKIGIPNDVDAEDIILKLLNFMEEQKADFTLTFRALAIAADDNNYSALNALFEKGNNFKSWLDLWNAKRLENNDEALSLKQINPIYIPRNHLVEDVIEKAYDGDFTDFERLNEILASPYTERADCSRYALPPRPEQRVDTTFCGT